MMKRHRGPDDVDYRRLAQFSVASLFDTVTGDRPTTPVLQVDSQRRTYIELRDASRRLARSLMAIGMGRGDRIGVLMHNSVECVEVFLAAAMLGCPIVPVNTRFKPREIRYVVRASGVRALLTADADDPVLGGRLIEALPELERATGTQLRLDDAPTLEVVTRPGPPIAPGILPRHELDAAAEDTDEAALDHRNHAVRARDPYVIFFTSGTTSDPKGCVLTHEAVLRAALHTSERFECDPGDAIWCPLPMFHTGFLQMFGTALWVGGTYVSMSFFEAGEALEQITSAGVGAMFPAFPIIMQGILNHPDYHADSLRTVKTAFNVGPPDSLADMQRRMPHTTLISGYGMTEFAGSITITSASDDEATRLTTQGRPFPGVDVEIRDEEGNRCQPGVTGEIVARGPTLFERYFGDEAATSAAIGDDGFFSTGDLGRLDEFGRLTYRGRLKDMLKVGGENVAAIEVESFLATHPAVSIAAVVGVPDPRLVEVPAAFVELRPGCTATEAELIQFCETGLARFKVPRVVRVVEEWPMSATKIQKYRLIEMLLEAHISEPDGDAR